MDETSSLWIVGIIALVVGGLVGMLIGRSSPAARRGEALLDELNETRRELEEYKSEVGEHFARTADLVNNLTESYRDVHQHLAKGATGLCKDAAPIKSLQAAETPILSEPTEPAEPKACETVADKSATDADVTAPRDYAPKSGPEDEGTLSERFGLAHEDKRKEEPPHDPSKTADHAPN